MDTEKTTTNDRIIVNVVCHSAMVRGNIKALTLQEQKEIVDVLP